MNGLIMDYYDYYCEEGVVMCVSFRTDLGTVATLRLFAPNWEI